MSVDEVGRQDSRAQPFELVICIEKNNMNILENL